MKVSIREEGELTYYEIDLTTEELEHIREGFYPSYSITVDEREFVFSVGLDLFKKR